MFSFPLFLAYTFLRGSSQKKSISTVMAVSFIGIMTGSFGLMLTLAIMNGFEQATHEQLQSIHAQAIIRAFGDNIHVPALAKVLEHEFSEIHAFSPYTVQQVMIQNPHTDDISTIVALKGIDPDSHSRVNALNKKIIQTDSCVASLAACLAEDHVLIGYKLAETLNVTVGDTVTLFYAPNEPRRKKITLIQKKAVIGGFFKTGIEEFDADLIFGSMALVQEMFPESGATHVQLSFKPGTDEQKTIEKLRQRLQLEVYSWKEMYPALVCALRLEKYVMFFILTLISIIAGMNIISLLFMQIYQKKSAIAVLYSMGMTAQVLRRIFLYIGLIIAAAASLTGIILALFICTVLRAYPCITLPDAYLVSYLPVSWQWYMPCMIFGLTLILSLIAVLIPLNRIEPADTVKLLKFDS